MAQEPKDENMNPRTAIRSAAQRNQEAQRRLKEAAVAAHGTIPISTIAELAGVTRPTIYAWLKEADEGKNEPARSK